MTQHHRIASGERIYAIGDPHGRLDLFAELMARIRADGAARRPLLTRIVVLGDVIDRGPQSAELVARLMAYTGGSDRFVVLKGNHEAMMEVALDSGDEAPLQAWLRFGGFETLTSWGVPEAVIRAGPAAAVVRAARAAIGPEAAAWIDARPLTYRSGAVVFTHAGVRPDVAWEAQTPEDLLWIRDEFLSQDHGLPLRIVHGHTVCEHGPEILAHRIGVDTGAYRTNRLSAVGLEGTRAWALST